MNFKDRDEKHITEKNLAWEDYLIDCAHAGYNVKNSATNRSLFMNGYHAGSENAESLEAQLVQAEDIANTSSIDLAIATAKIATLENQLAAAKSRIETLRNALHSYAKDEDWAEGRYAPNIACRVLESDTALQKENTDES